ncbi:MAG: autotransporter-associated beta strand repeat-containing protein [Verrucomicrobia bacterium]|nr:autotransporter-associated beta strand repeat-containing protein [Verrucomicrobiota bacterium]
MSNGVLTLANGAANTLGAVTVNGGTLIVDSTNTAVSVTIGTGGTVQIGNTDANGSLAQNITDNGSLLFNRSDAFTYGNVVSGSGTLTKNAAGTLTLTAEHSYTGDTIVNGGVLVFNYPGSTYFTYNGGNLFINNRATLRFTGSRYDLSGKIFTFDSNGGGVLDTVSGLNFVAWAANTYTTTGGAQNSIIGSSGMNVNAGVIDIFDLARGTGPSDLKVAAPIWNTGGITKIGNGILELAGVNTYSGGTTVAAGTLLVTGQLTGNGPVTVDDNAALKVTARGAISAITNATDLTLGSSGASTLGFVNLSSTNVAPINVANVYVNGTVTISVSGGLGVGQLPLIKYSTSEALAGTFTLALPAGVSATLVDNTANQSLDLNVTAAPASILTDLSGTTNYLYAGGTYTASVVGAGSAPLTYLWKKNGTIPVGANSPTLTLSNVTTNDSGSYSVTVTNTLGSAHSATNYLVVLPPSGYSAIVMAAGPTAYWPLNESAGYVATDYSSGYNGTYTSGGVTYGVAGPVGNTVVTLDGSSGSVSIPYTSALNPSGPFTVELWVNPTQVPFPGSVAYVASSVEVNGNRSGWYLAQDNGTTFSHGSAFVVRLFNQNSTTPTITLWAPVTASGWYYLTLTYDGTTAALYENGVLATSGTAGYVGNVDAPFTIGKRSDGAYSWPGSVGDVAVYGRALTAQEIQTHAQIAPSLQIGRVGQQVVLTWSGSGTLQAAPVVTGPYTNVPAATSPWTNTPSAGSEFWRVKF